LGYSSSSRVATGLDRECQEDVEEDVDAV